MPSKRTAMLFETSYYSKATKEEINNLVGKPFGLLKRIKLRGIGSQRMLIIDASAELESLINQQNTPPYTNIELRPGGVMLWFRVKLDSYVLALPYDQLSVFNTSEGLSFHAGSWRIKMKVAHQLRPDRAFVFKLLKMKSDYLGASEGPNRSY
ncbi:MAG: hypothetical protein ABJF11_03530 [Reichenbachiella sp.]|uniref:hypothetical protein n=1 Tax=Reichenbachiella sp. TaxID=2184521 RepID=UPI0032650E87